MELEQLRQIEAIARTGTMSAASKELHLSQPALSRSTPHCLFTTDAPFLTDARTGRAVVPIADEAANAVFHLVIRKDAGRIPSGLFERVARSSS